MHSERSLEEPIQVIAYCGYQGEQEPRAVILAGERHAVTAVDDRWIEPGSRCFRVRIRGGRRLLLRYDLGSLTWHGQRRAAPRHPGLA